MRLICLNLAGIEHIVHKVRAVIYGSAKRVQEMCVSLASHGSVGRSRRPEPSSFRIPPPLVIKELIERAILQMTVSLNSVYYAVL